MIVSVHQPNYLPYLGYFDKMVKSDVFVIYDDAQFKKNEFQHRNKIRIKEGWKYLTVPVEKKRKPINEVKIKNDVLTSKGLRWYEDHLHNINDNYKDAPYFDRYKNEISSIYERTYEILADLNMDLIYFLRSAFNIKTKLVFSSEMGFKSKGTERLVDMVKALGGDVYISGKWGRDYLDLKLFEQNDIKVEFQDYKHPVYEQQYEGFEPNMSAIDALFNVGRIPK